MCVGGEGGGGRKTDFEFNISKKIILTYVSDAWKTYLHQLEKKNFLRFRSAFLIDETLVEFWFTKQFVFLLMKKKQTLHTMTHCLSSCSFILRCETKSSRLVEKLKSLKPSKFQPRPM